MNDITFWSVVTAGVYLFLPVAALFLTSIVIFFVKLASINKALKNGTTFMERVRDYVIEGDLDNATGICEHHDNLCSRVVKDGIAHIGRPVTEIREIMEAPAEIEVISLKRGLVWLKACGIASALIGLAGTVIGWAIAFNSQSSQEITPDLQSLFSLLWQGLITSACGLAAALISILLYTILASRINLLIRITKQTVAEFIDLLEEPAY